MRLRILCVFDPDPDNPDLPPIRPVAVCDHDWPSSDPTSYDDKVDDYVVEYGLEAVREIVVDVDDLAVVDEFRLPRIGGTLVRLDPDAALPAGSPDEMGDPLPFPGDPLTATDDDDDDAAADTGETSGDADA